MVFSEMHGIRGLLQVPCIVQISKLHKLFAARIGHLKLTQCRNNQQGGSPVQSGRDAALFAKQPRRLQEDKAASASKVC